jgi:nuclear mRNA export protein PCID2/THP1
MSLTRQFLSHLNSLVRQQNGDALRAWLQVLPSAPTQYHSLAAELRSHFPSATGGDSRLDTAVETGLPEDDDVPDGQATAWPGLLSFVKEYLMFWRDVDFENLVRAHALLSGLLNACSTAFAHPQYGGMLLKTSMSLSEALSQLTMMLNKRPELMTGQRRTTGGEEERKSLAEMSAEIIQKIFTTCLTDRSVARNGRPEGKKIGVYMFANLVLRLLFAVSVPGFRCCG